MSWIAFQRARSRSVPQSPERRSRGVARAHLVLVVAIAGGCRATHVEALLDECRADRMALEERVLALDRERHGLRIALADAMRTTSPAPGHAQEGSPAGTAAAADAWLIPHVTSLAVMRGSGIDTGDRAANLPTARLWLRGLDQFGRMIPLVGPVHIRIARFDPAIGEETTASVEGRPHGATDLASRRFDAESVHAAWRSGFGEPRSAFDVTLPADALQPGGRFIVSVEHIDLRTGRRVDHVEPLRVLPSRERVRAAPGDAPAPGDTSGTPSAGKA